MLKKIIFLCVALIAGVVLTSCTGTKNISYPFPGGDESAFDPLSIPEGSLQTFKEYCA